MHFQPKVDTYKQNDLDYHEMKIDTSAFWTEIIGHADKQCPIKMKCILACNPRRKTINLGNLRVLNQKIVYS